MALEQENVQARVGDINFGSIEAKHDLIGATPSAQRQFVSSYVKPQSVSYSDIFQGNKFLVYGVKGTGKTALLHYLSLLAKDNGRDTQFLLFSKHVTEDDRRNLSKAAGYSITEYQPRQIEQDFEAVWLWYFHRHVAKTLSNQEFPSPELSAYVKYVSHVSGDSETSWTTKLWRLLPSFKNGKIEIKGKIPAAEAGISGEFEARGDHHEVSLTKAAERANELLEDIGQLSVEHIIFVDELELTLSSSVDFVRDGRTISGLIRAAAHINEILRITQSNFKIVCAVRSEVLRSSYVSGDEINKIVFDFGIPIKWNHAFNEEGHPLLKIIENRIISSFAELQTTVDRSQIWNRFFPDAIQGVWMKNWILDRTWYRPRDIVRLLTICRDFDKDGVTFSQNAFEQSARDYSDSCWIEISEELRSSYTVADVTAVKTLFTGIQSKPLTYQSLVNIIHQKASSHVDIHNLVEKRPINEMLEDFFRVGIIGNEHKLRISGAGRAFHNWYFRNGDSLLFDKEISVHRGLRHTFRMISR